VDDVVPAIDAQDPEHVVMDRLVAGEIGVVEEADDPGDHQDGPDQARIQASRT
jgi:hypothetical protein